MLHMTCDVIVIAQYHFFEIQDGGYVFCTLSKFKAFFGQFALENVRNRTKTVLVTLIVLNTRDLSKIVMLLFTS